MDDPGGFGSHLPTLRFLLAVLKPRRVLEIGAGLYSTPEFLEHICVTALDSVEEDAEWRARVKEANPDDRLHLFERLPKQRDLTRYDLIFVDNASTVEGRVAAIKMVLSQPHPVTVLHDSEYPDYHQVIEELAEGRYISVADPQHSTAICW